MVQAKRIRIFLMLTALIFLFMLSGCITAKYLSAGWTPQKIAVLPFTNQSSDVAVEKFARVVMYQTLQRYGFDVMPLEVVDAKLDELGITEGGHLAAITVDELAQAIPANSFLYGEVIEAQRIMLGVYFSKKFKANFKICSANPEVLQWEDEREDKESKVVLSPVELAKVVAQQFVLELASDAIYKLLDSHPLIYQIRAVVNMSAITLPRQKYAARN